MMVTGDYHHTAIAVARGVGMVPPGGQVIIIQAKPEEQAMSRTASILPSALKSAHSVATTPRPLRRGVSFAQEALTPSLPDKAEDSAKGQKRQNDGGPRAQRSAEGLTFMLDSGVRQPEDLEPLLALTTIAQAFSHSALPRSCSALISSLLPCPVL